MGGSCSFWDYFFINVYLGVDVKTQRELIIQCLSKGWKTPLDALKEAGTMKLATRVGELKTMGYPIIDRWHESRKFKEYKLLKIKK